MLCLASVLLQVHFCMIYLIESFRKEIVEKGESKTRDAEEEYEVQTEEI